MPTFMSTEPLPLLKPLQQDFDKIIAELERRGTSQVAIDKTKSDIVQMFSALTQALSKTEGPSSVVNMAGLPKGQFGRRRRRKTRRYYK